MADATISSTALLPVAIKEQFSGEDLPNHVLGVLTKPVSSITYSTSNYKDSGSVTKANVKAAAGSIFSLRFTNDSSSARYLQIHNKATAPAASETANRYWRVRPGTDIQLDSSYFVSSHFCSTGIGWAVSTTATTFTDSATGSEHSIDINYV